MAYATINPYTGETLKTFSDATDSEVAEAIAKAYSAFLNWKETSFAERAKILQKAADLLRRDANDYAKPHTGNGQTVYRGKG
jgi:succinate-semialdehyde dehydrogenase/glutarate-semialdehyde dehydrogenase